MNRPRRLVAARVVARVGARLAVAVGTGLLGACGGVALPQAEVLEPAPEVEAVDPVAYESFLRARLLEADGYYEEAADELRRAIHAEPQAPSLHLALGEVLAAVPGSTDEGLMACSLALDLDASVAEVAVCRGRLHEADGDLDSAIEVYRAVPAEAAEPIVYRRWLAATESGEEGARVEAARAFTVAFPESAAAWRALGASLAETDSAEAADAFGWASRLPDPDPYDAYRQISLLVSLEEWDAALESAVDCRERFWEFWPCSSWAAVLHDRGRAPEDPLSAETTEALEHLAFMVSLDARELGRSGAELMRAADPSLVAAYARIVADTRPDDSSAVSSAAWMANNIEDYGLAVALMERVLAIDDANFDALNYIGYIWAEQGENLEQAEVYIREALFLRGDDGNILDSLAWVQFRMARFEEALATQLRAIELVDDNAVLWDHLGDIYRALGRTEDAIDAWTRALEYADERDEDVLDDAPRKIREASGAV